MATSLTSFGNGAITTPATSRTPIRSNVPTRKHGISSNDPENRRKAPKVTRACDQCKKKKARCSGTNPCDDCTRRKQQCTWEAKYSRGTTTVPLPPAARPSSETSPAESQAAERTQAHANTSAISESVAVIQDTTGSRSRRAVSDEGLGNDAIPSRGSPELESAQIRGQYYDSTSSLTFVHRAWRRISAQNRSVPDVSNGGEKRQPMVSAGDWPMSVDTAAPWQMPDRMQAHEMLSFYFDSCVVTYRCLHRPSVENWLEAVQTNLESGLALENQIGHAKAAAVVSIFAIVTFRKEQIRSSHLVDGSRDFEKGDRFFIAARNLSDTETGLPRLESAQARILQVLYLLQTARMNQSWYVLGNTLQIISALGLHRRPHCIWNATPRTPNLDYVNVQCRKRTFWVAYTLDKYVCVVLGRPSHYHDNDIDQEFPDRVNDDEMGQHGPNAVVGLNDCHVDGLIAHAKLAQIIGDISADVYSIHRKPKQQSALDAQKHSERLREWRTNLQPHLGTIRPSSLIPIFRRQSIALKLAYSHAIMHASRPFLLGNMSTHSDTSEVQENVTQCLSAANDALQTVDLMATDGTMFYSLWWTYYVTFCALSVIYIWKIQLKNQSVALPPAIDSERLFELAERCHIHLVQPAPINSPSRAYSVILEELRVEADLGISGPSAPASSLPPTGHDQHRAQSTLDAGQRQFDVATANDVDFRLGLHLNPGDMSIPQIHPNLNDWETTDWLDFDSSAFLPFYSGE